MKRRTVFLLLCITLLLLSACGVQDTEKKTAKHTKPSEKTKDTEKDEMDAGNTDNREENTNERKSKMIIEVNGQQFQAELYDNDTVSALTEILPMTLQMDEMNGNEKYYFMEESLPADSESVVTIQNGDIMLYGSECLVLFFKTFETSYSYTRIGQIEDAESFAAALDSGTVEISFRMQ